MNTTKYQKARHDLAIALWDIGAVLTVDSNHPLVVERQGPKGTERGFPLKLHEKNSEAPLSPFYLNLRTPDNPKPGPLTTEVVEQAARCMQGILANVRPFDALAGVPRAGEPFAETLARLTGKPCITMEKWEHEGKRKIASLKSKVPASVYGVLLVDDLITGATSKREAIEVLRDEGLEVTDVVVLVDREQGGHEELGMLGCVLHSVFSISELLDFYVTTGKMSAKTHSKIQAYLAKA